MRYHTLDRMARSVTVVLATFLLAGVGRAEEIDIRPHWDAERPLANPHKGWYHHFPDNHVNKYIIRDEGDLTGLPGMDHLYMRLAWAYLEPEEGRYRWDVIDEHIEKWTAKGLGIAFRISCRETSTDRPEQQFATPRWVVDAGASGGYYVRGERVGPEGPWEPDFADPVFLDKLDGFLAAFAARYDGRRWLRYVDIGSIGDWGEGHTSHGSRRSYGYDVRKRHVDLHLRHFRRSPLVVSDDFVYAVDDPEERERLNDYIVANGISYRDDSILVKWYVKTYLDTYTVRSPQYFEDVWRDRPTVLELQHYHAILSDGNWWTLEDVSRDSASTAKTGADVFRGALATLHATYIGYHGDARQWLDDNPALTVELLNRCGYWYFLHGAEVPDKWRRGADHEVTLRWENRGVAPAYHDYALDIRLQGPTTIDLALDAGNRRWLPRDEGAVYAESYPVSVPGESPPGEYELRIRLRAPETDEVVDLALDQGIRDTDGYFRLGMIRVMR